MSPSRVSTRAMERRRRRRVRRISVLAGLLCCTGLVWQSTHATFTASTSNGPNQLGAGTVVITDNDNGAAMFTTSTVAPGDVVTVCMGVQYNGSVTPTAIRLYFTGAQEANNGGGYGTWVNDNTSELDDNLSMLIQVNSNDLNSDPGSSCAPAGYGSFTDVTAASPGTNMRTLITGRTDYASGLPSQWGTVTPARWRTFKFTYTFSAAAPNTAQGDGLKFNVVWEAQR